MGKWLLGMLRLFIVCSPILLAGLWTSWSAIGAVSSAYSLKIPSPQVFHWDDQAQISSLKRSVQRHFSDYGTYIPMDDIQIIFGKKGRKIADSLTMQKVQDRATLMVWIPLRFTLPLLGVKVIEWPWILELK